jgi:PAS domain S-box-containing protein
MFGWGADGIRSLEAENRQLKARIKALEGSFEPRNVLSVHTAPCIIFGIAPNLTINVWNQEAARITGHSSDEAIGQDLNFLIAEENLGLFRGIVETATNSEALSKAASELEISVLGKDGKRIVLLNFTTRKDSDGIIDTIFVGQDITKRKHSEEEKIRLATELQTFIDVANAAIFGIDHAGRINEWNHQSAEITGLSKDEVIGKDFLQVLIEPEFQASVQHVLQNALEGRGTANFEFPFFTKDRRRVDVLLNATTRRDADGAVIGVIGVGQVAAAAAAAAGAPVAPLQCPAGRGFICCVGDPW